jgi:uncharacterized protein (DUF2141 family)
MAGFLKAGAAAALALAASPAAGQAPLGPDSASCRRSAGESALLVTVRGFREPVGTVRVQAYRAREEEFLAPGRYVRRIDLPVGRGGTINVCVALPEPGRYAIAVRHDEDEDGRTSWSDGGGFSNNPPLSLAARPTAEEAAVEVGRGVKRVEVLLHYRYGLTVRPAEGG